MVYFVVATITVIIIIIAIRTGTNKRNNDLDAWGASIPLTDVQKAVMQELWKASQLNRPPDVDPLARLSSQDLAYTLKICSSNYRPARFGNADTLRLASFLKLQENGFTTEQASVIIGMQFNGVGR